ncbi:MAG: molybdenum cofactor guanylyltransferase [Bacteroidales bacterium]
MPWTAAIIAGGAASRLDSRDKSRLLVGNRSILERQLAAIRPLTDHVMVVANRPERFADTPVRVVPDMIAGAGALGGIYTALATASTEHVVAIACDMPFITSAFLARLVALAAEADLVIPKPADGYQPLCACYSRACVEPIRRRIGVHALRVQDLAEEVRVREVGPAELAEFDASGLLFFNVNTPGDHDRAEQLVAERHGQPQS